MSGTILISSGRGVPLSGWAFRYFIEAIRKQLLNIGGERFLREIFFGSDEAFSGFISVVEQDAEGFALFYRATHLASLEEPEDDKAGRAVWQNLLDILRSDPRWVAPTS